MNKQHLMTRCSDCSKTAERLVWTYQGKFQLCAHHAYEMTRNPEYIVTRNQPLHWTGDEHKAY